jgi:RES domain-containing protein
MRMETAWLEAQQGFPFKAQPMTICAYVVDCDNIADLTDPATRSALGVDVTTLACAWEDMASRGLIPPSWILADRMLAAGFAGILVPSFAVGATPVDVNAVFWTWQDDPPHQVRVIDDYGRLPRNDQSWH